MLIAAEILSERPAASSSIDKWFSGDHANKLANKPVAEPKTTNAPGGIWGEFDSESVPDAVLLTAVDSVEQRHAEMHFPGRGHKLSDSGNTSQVDKGTIVRRIPGIGVISGRTAADQSRPVSTPPAANNVVTNQSHRWSFSDNAPSPSIQLTPTADTPSASQGASPDAPIQFESVEEFRKIVGMDLYPPGTVVSVKNFTSVCSPRPSPLPSRADISAPRLKSGRAHSDGDLMTAVRPAKKMRSDVENSKLKITECNDSKKLAGDSQTNHLEQKLDSTMSLTDNDCVIAVDSDSETSGVEGNIERRQNVETEMNVASSAASNVVPSQAIAEAGPSDQVVGGIDTSLLFQETGVVDCPVCQMSVLARVINQHLDQCLA